MRLSSTRVLTILAGLVVALASARVEAKTVYVKADAAAGGNGKSWNKAYDDLQDALDDAAATPGSDEIWIAEGSYAPSRIYSPLGPLGPLVGGACAAANPACASALDALKTFDLPDKVAIYGGFAGTEKSRASRSPAAHETVLTGGGTSWHVVTAGNDIEQTGVTAVLDGLTITGGNAVGPAGNDLLFQPFNYGHNLGGGLYVAFDSVVDVDDVHFVGNHAGDPIAFSGDGGGLFSINSTLTVSGSRFTNNSAVLRGGGLEVLNTYEGNRHHDSRIVRSTFTGNVVGIFGGAIVGEGTVPNPQSSMLIDDCTFDSNYSAFEGGAIVFDSLKTTVRNSRFNNNVAVVAAGALATTNVVDTFVYGLQNPPIYSFPKFETRVENCEFNNNIAQGDQTVHDQISGAFGVNFARGGGALVTYLNGYLNVVNSTFSGNLALEGEGGAILNGHADAVNVFNSHVNVFDVETTVVGSTFTGNEARAGNGGAIASEPGANTVPERTVANTRLSVLSSAFIGNRASLQGGGIYLRDSTATLHGNKYQTNQPNHVYGTDSIVNGSPATPYVQ